MKKRMMYFVLIFGVLPGLTGCSNDDEPDVFVDEPNTEVVEDYIGDYYVTGGVTHRLQWMDNFYFVSSEKADKVTAEFLSSKGIAVVKCHKSYLDENKRKDTKDPYWAFYEIASTNAISNIVDFRNAIDDNEVYCAPVNHETPTLPNKPWSYGLQTPSRRSYIILKEGCRPDFIKLYHSYGANSDGYNGLSFRMDSPKQYTSIEMSNIYYASGLIDDCDISFDRYEAVSITGL